MKNEKILHAMSKISDELIENATIKKKHFFYKSNTTDNQNFLPASGRTFRIGIAVALITCLLGTAVFATRSLIFNGYNPQVNDSWDGVTPTEDDGSSHSVSVYQLSFCLPLNENAPERIETYYFPQVPEMYTQSFGMAYAGMNYDKLCSIIYAWDIPDGAVQEMMFYQESGFDSNEIMFHANGTPGNAPEMKEAGFGGKEGVLIVEPTEVEFPRKYFFWSDGNYVFHMQFPVEFTEEQMAQIVGSVSEVEEVRQYLISMTEEQMMKTFG